MSCDRISGTCKCLNDKIDSKRCDRCIEGYYNFPFCIESKCNPIGSILKTSFENGQCHCKQGYTGLKCDRCDVGFYDYLFIIIDEHIKYL